MVQFRPEIWKKRVTEKFKLLNLQDLKYKRKLTFSREEVFILKGVLRGGVKIGWGTIKLKLLYTFKLRDY